MNNLIQWSSAKYWTRAWNPIIGCKPCSPACENCYAAAWAKRFHKSFAPTVYPQTRPSRSGVVFCGNMTDLFGEWLFQSPGNYILKSTEDFISKCDSPKATYLWLTKRVERMALSLSVGQTTTVDEEGDVHYIRIRDLDLSNHYFGFTAENQKWHDRRAEQALLTFPTWANNWMSCEPLLGPIDLKFSGLTLGGRPAYDWLVVGCESGPNRRPCKLEWVEEIVEQCRAANVPVFVKQLDIGGKCVTDINKFPRHLRIRQVPWAKEGSAK